VDATHIKVHRDGAKRWTPKFGPGVKLMS
jgi:hypothetical protein